MRRLSKSLPAQYIYLVLLSLAANQRQGFMEILHSDWLMPKVGQNLRRGRLVNIPQQIASDKTLKRGLIFFLPIFIFRPL